MPQDAYTRAGVSQADADGAVAALVTQLSRIDTGRPARNVELGGHYASVLRLDRRRGLAIGTDGVGTKMLVAERLGRFDSIGIDCVAMNVNDLICVGADPIAMLDFILCARAEPEVCGAIGEGLRAGAEQARVEIPGGEIAQVGDIVSGYELTGTAVGLVELDRIIDGSRVEPGDVIVGVPSSGLHSNGYTLARAALDGLDLDAEHGLGRSLGEVLLEPTTIYVRAVAELLEAGLGVHGLAHITGDGLNNLLRLRAPVGYEIDRPLDVPGVFNLIAERGGVAEAEMHEVFNMGCGLVCVLAAADADAATAILARHHPGSRAIGTVTAESGEVRRTEAT